MKIAPKTVFFMTGLALWALCGSMISMGCFQPTVSLEEMQANKELATQVCNAWGRVMWKVSTTWALSGGILGLIICGLFTLRPMHEHYTRAPVPDGMPNGPGPKTMAELHTAFQSWVLGIIVGVCGIIFVLPSFQNELLVVKQSYGTVIFGGILSFLMTVLILPFSLSTLRKMAESDY